MFLGRGSNDGDLNQEPPIVAEVPRPNANRDCQQHSTKREAHASLWMSIVCADSKGKATQVGPQGSWRSFMGYGEALNAYRVYDIEAGKVVITCDVKFDELTL